MKTPIDKEVRRPVKDHKRKHDSDDDEDDGLMKALQLITTSPSFTSTGWQITDTRDTGADSPSMHRSDHE
ncbi:hypothetical protein Tco_0413284 [Tanacetum coccineum]